MALKSKQQNRSNSSRAEYQPLNLNVNHDVNFSHEREVDQQGNKIVEINRLLSADQYGVGKQLQEFKTRFMNDLTSDADFKNPSKYVAYG